MKWIAEINVSDICVRDGFTLTEEHLKDMVLNDLSFATEDEIEVRILEAPLRSAIKKVQE